MLKMIKVIDKHLNRKTFINAENISMVSETETGEGIIHMKNGIAVFAEESQIEVMERLLAFIDEIV